MKDITMTVITLFLVAAFLTSLRVDFNKRSLIEYDYQCICSPENPMEFCRIIGSRVEVHDIRDFSEVALPTVRVMCKDPASNLIIYKRLINGLWIESSTNYKDITGESK